jgi:hypothetical protein
MPFKPMKVNHLYLVTMEGLVFLGRLQTRVQGLGTNEFKQTYWSKAFKLVPRPLDEGPKDPKKGAN